MAPRALYIGENIVVNALAPVIQRVRGPGGLGMDGDLRYVGETLGWLAEGLRATGVEARGRRVLELGPGRTCELLLAFVAAGAERGLGVDTHVRVPSGCVSPRRLEDVAELLRASDGSFLAAVGASRDSVSARLAELADRDVPVAFSGYDGHAIPLPDDSVDLVYSKSVLEHVAAEDVAPLVAELRRVLTPGGAMVHIIDLRDHMRIDKDAVTGNWLEALTYPEWLFRAMFSKRPVSINRLRAPDWERLWQANGFRIALRRDYRLALPAGFERGRLQAPWRTLDDDTLEIAQVAFALTA